MSEKMVTTLSPQYVKEFKCIGGACQDTCCAGWYIGVDKETYQKYRKVKNQEIRKKLDKNVTRNRSNPTDENYAKLKLIDGRCSFIAEDGLCEVHRDLGEESLCMTCTTYPRATNKVNQVIENSLTLSCPEAARLVLLNEKPMEFDELLEQDKRKRIGGRVNLNVDNVVNWKDYFWPIRIFIIGLLQNRNFSIEERLFILGLFLKKISEYSDAEKINYIPIVIEEYNRNLSGNLYKKAFQEIPTAINVQVEFCQELMQVGFLNEINKSYAECLQQLIEGLEWQEEIKVEDYINKFVEKYKLYYQPFMQENQYILENYLVNYVFKELVPLDKEEIFDSYIKLILHYLIIKIHLMGIGSYNKKLTIENVVRTISKFSKKFEHNPNLFNQVIEDMKKQSLKNMGYMCTLIKN